MLEPTDYVFVCLFCFVFFTVLFPTGPGGRTIQKMTPPSLQFDPKRQQYNTGPNDTLKTYMPIFRKNGTHFGLRYGRTGTLQNGGRAVLPPKGYSIRPPPALAGEPGRAEIRGSSLACF